MELGMIGLGKMGGNMTRRLLAGGHKVVVYAPTPAHVAKLVEEGAAGSASLAELVEKLAPPRTVWVMVPSGNVTEKTVETLSELLSTGDTVIDGGNCNYRESQSRAEALRSKGIKFIDVGTSGGVWGLTEGYSMMVGGDTENVERHRPIFETLAPAPDKGWGRVGENGAGHFVKMVHNGIEYGLMEAYAEGFEIMKAKEEFGLSLKQVADIWSYGSVVRSWLLELVSRALADDENLSHIKGWVDDTGEGRWTVLESIDLNVPAPVITLSLQSRFRSREDDCFADRLLAALRNQFGGHDVKTVE
ncbi:6-phosphogluconate dehydrogenase, NAD(+)-dependent, decarboxylating [bacterium BMS3Abin01]|nr:6-phosphogluconate dehydrogenase, NAD(+)-dependent, decarboxylating [bacterium BMS3Abin01]